LQFIIGMKDNIMYQYKHTNGQIISKPDHPVDHMGTFEYFDSPYVVAWWHINDETGQCDKHLEEWLEHSEKIKEIL